MAALDTVGSLVKQLGLALAPLANALSTPDRAQDFLESLGWEFATPPQEVTALGPIANDVLNIVIQDEIDDVQSLLDAVAKLVLAIAAFETATDLPADFKSEFPRQVFDFLIIEYLFGSAPAWGFFLLAIGVITITPGVELPSREPFTKYVFAIENLKSLLADPLGYLKTTYAWGTSGFDGARLLESTAGLLDAWGLIVREPPVDAAVRTQLNSGALPSASTHNTAITLVLYEDDLTTFTNAGVGLFVLPETATDKPGFALLPFSQTSITETVGVTPNITLTFQGQVDLTSPVGVFVRPSKDVQFLSGLDSGAPAPVAGTFSIKLTLADQLDPVVILGTPAASRVEFAGVSTKAAVRFAPDQSLEVAVELQLVGAQIVIDASSSGDGFLGSVMPAGGTTMPLNLGVGFSTTRGIYLLGTASFDVTIPAHIALGPIEVQTVSVSVKPNGDSLPVQVTSSLTVDLSVLKATIDGLGFALNVALKSDNTGNLGPVDVGLGFVPPTGIGIAIDAGPVSGGGFISFDRPNHRYFGALELSIYSVSVKAFGVIDTKLPTGPGFSFLIIISAEFTPIQLGFGFTLNGVGGLLGINRSVDSAGLLTVIKSGQLDNVLFPDDVIDNAPAILNDVETLFPPTKGHYVFGPMAKIGWGTPTLVDGELGLIIEYPGPVLTVIGTVHAALPTPDEAVVELNLDVGGVLDFPNKKFSLDASLHDSRVGDFPVSGDMAMRMNWGQNPNFALSIGGFHPHYNPPAGFPKLKPVSVDLGSNGNPSIVLSGYMALTSNTAQVGALVKASISKYGASLSGYLGFDALFVFSPFSFEADIGGGVSVSIDGCGFSLNFHGTLSGPSPWHLAGKVCVSLFFFDACADFSTTLGGTSQPKLPGVDPWTGSLPLNADGTQTVPGLQPALSLTGNWGGNPPAGSFPAVTLIAAPQGAQAPIDPLGSATFRQKAVPLDLLITSFAGTAPTPQRNLDVKTVVVGSQTLTEPTRVTDYFAPGQYQKMKDADKLSSQSFVQLNAGFTISSDALTFGPSASEGLIYTDVTFAAPVGSPPTITADAYPPSQTHVTTVTGRSAAVNAGLRNSALAAFVDPKAVALVNLANELYTIANIANLFGASGFATNVPRPVATTALAAAAAISATARQTLQVAPTFFVQPSTFVL